MKNLCFIIFIIILMSCTADPNSVNNQVIQTKFPKIDHTLPPPPMNTQTQALTAGTTPTPTAPSTSTSTISLTSTNLPSATITPTQDLSFYDIADCIPRNTLYQVGTVSEVIDGDTITVRLEDGKTYSVRYIGIDAPENGRPFSAEASSANSEMLLQKDVILIKDMSETDQFDRLLRYVIADDRFVNLEMVKKGLAEAFNYPPDVACANTFSSAQEQARASMFGMWVATQTPIPSAPQVIIVTVNKREEWVDLKNTGNIDVDLEGWNLVSERGNQDCPLSGIIKVGDILRIWAMTPKGPGFSCGYNTNIWNNSEVDPAVLYNAQGEEVSRK
jgi:endonuclease YncB( thermonuclease family)